MHQVNADGAPTYFADVDTTGTGMNFQPAQVTAGGQGAGGILGDQGLSFNIGSLPANNTVQVQMPSTACTGTDPTTGATGMCIMRVYNKAAAGGFGSCAAVMMGGGNSTTASTGSTGSTAATGSTASTNKKERRHARQLTA